MSYDILPPLSETTPEEITNKIVDASPNGTPQSFKPTPIYAVRNIKRTRRGTKGAFGKSATNRGKHNKQWALDFLRSKTLDIKLQLLTNGRVSPNTRRDVDNAFGEGTTDKIAAALTGRGEQ